MTGDLPLADQIARRIRLNGPLTVADYMTDCLLHPQHGYYATREPFGRTGDFITSPEISQMFGELLGLALAQAWQDQGAPASFVLAELGPGRGTLMRDALRATAGVPGFHAAAQVHLVEASARLRAVQLATLAETANAVQLTWADGLSALPDRPLFLIANEFFDALPIRQFQRDGEGWREKCVTIGPNGLIFALADTAPQPDLADRLNDTRDGDVVEVCAAAKGIAQELGRRIAHHGGAALIVDYGAAQSIGDTLQAIYQRGHSDPLLHPGQADLTAHVDFGSLIRAAAPAHASTLTDQGVLLERLGITERARMLARGLTGDGLDAHVSAHRRLTHPQEMGSLFKTISLTPQGASLPPGYSE